MLGGQFETQKVCAYDLPELDCRVDNSFLLPGEFVISSQGRLVLTYRLIVRGRWCAAVGSNHVPPR